MSGRYSAVVSELLYNESNKSEWTQPKKKLSGTKLGMCAINALSTEMEVEITLEEFKTGGRFKFEIVDQYSCNSCINLKPINRLQCQQCRGLGYTQSKRSEDVLVPAGLVTGQRITYKGLGRRDYRSGQASDLIITVRVADHNQPPAGA